MTRILCVEDDDETSLLLSEALTQLGYSVELAPDGISGLALIRNQCPDLVICDVQMPRMTGFELLENVIAAGPSFRDLAFVFLTALADRNSELIGLRLGADHYLTKPVDFEMLGIVIENRLRRSGYRPSQECGPSLTDREKEVLTWVARGKTSSEIGTILSLAERTVNFHCDQAMKRLDVSNRTQAIAKAITCHLIVA